MARGRRSAGLLLYRRRGGALEVFLVHPGGPFWARRDAGAWSIPKGEIEGDEEPLAAARREVEEETGLAPAGPFIALPPVRQAGGKTVLAFAAACDADPQAIRSNRFAMEWPPRSGRMEEFPEVDRAAWFDLETARAKLLPGQCALLDALAGALAGPTRA